VINEIGGTIKDITNENKDKTKVLKVIRGVIIDITNENNDIAKVINDITKVINGITKVINGIEEQINASWEAIIDRAKAVASEEGYELGNWVGRFLIAQKY